MPRPSRAALLALLAACGGGGSSGDPGTALTTDGTPGSPGGAPGWVVVAEERFESPLPEGVFAPDPVPDDGPFSDAGIYFRRKGVSPPAAFRASVPFGIGRWLTAELYTRRPGAATGEQVSVVEDPADPANRALRVHSREHTDAAVIRPSEALPPRYRISLRVGFPDFGDGPLPNGYDGGETAGPWWPSEDATRQNGFYWLTVLDHLPRPHNNTWIHHHRKVVVDSDNHPEPAWIEVWNGSGWQASGVHPVNLFAIDGTRPGAERSGPPFLPYANGAWQPSGTIRAVDAYLPGRWYRVTIERDGPRYGVEVAGTFRYGGETAYRATIDAAARCVFHYPATAEEAAAATRCEDPGAFASTAPEHARWPAGGVWPDWFMFGDPHVNYYEGSVLYDDVVLEEWRD